jgi:uncharacterized protein (UPF0333 family)
VRKMDSKGQASAEYLLLILVILIIMGAVTIPLIANSIGSSTATSQVSDAKTALTTIANAVDIVYSNGPGAKRTFDVYFPKSNGNVPGDNSANLVVDNGAKTVGMNIVYFNGKDSSGADTYTSKYVNVTTPQSTAYNMSLVVSNPPLSKGWHNIQVEWQRNVGIVITVLS